MNEKNLLQRVCVGTGCGKLFTITAGERQFYEAKGWELPKRCESCREKKRQVNQTKLQAN